MLIAMKKLGFSKARTYLDGQKIVETSFQVEDGKFSFNTFSNDLPSLDQKYIVVPGFIEQHVHGCNGSDTMNGDTNSIHNILSSLPVDGVTSAYLTTMTMSEDKIIKVLSNLGNYKLQKGDANLLGVHLEGPFISKKYAGAQSIENIVPIDMVKLDKFIQASNNMIKIITLAPECNDNSYISLLNNKGIVVSLGHSDATFKQASDAFKLGAKQTTHTYNAMRGIHHRDIGLLGAAMTHENVYNELIVDRIHVSDEAVRLLLRNKNSDHIILISDSMEARFLKDGTYSLGGQEVNVENGKATLNNGVLAGSVLHLNDALRNMKFISDLPMEAIIDMVSKNVAKNLNIPQKGIISHGFDADFVIIDEDFNVFLTVRGGEIIYQKEGFEF